MSLTPEQSAVVAKVDRLYAALASRRPKVDKLERYFDGDQPLCYASDEWRKFHGQRFRGFADNWCGVVGSAAPELTEIAGIRLGDDTETLSDDERRLWRDWDINNGQAQAAQGFLSGAVTSRSFTMVWGNSDDEPVLTWEHASQCIVSGEDSLKAWIEDDRERVNLYTPSGVWKFYRPAWTSGLSAESVTESGLKVIGTLGEGRWSPLDGDEWVPNPLGVNPIVEWPNRPVLRRGPISDIDGTVAMQDAANLMWAYLFGAADYASMPARVVMGQEPPKIPILDDKGQVIGEKALDIQELTKGRMLWLTGQATTIGQWEAAKLDVFTGVIDVMVKHIAAQTKTPINYMGALSNVNGETLAGLRTPLYMKVRDAHKHLTAPARRTFQLMALVRGDAAAAEACRSAQILWMNPETATDSQTADAALKDVQAGWSHAGILERRYGMSQAEIERELARRESERGGLDPYLIARADGQRGDAAEVG